VLIFLHFRAVLFGLKSVIILCLMSSVDGVLLQKFINNYNLFTIFVVSPCNCYIFVL